MPGRQDRLGGEAAELAVAVAGRQPLGEPPAVGDREQLRPPADRERRHRPLARGGDQRELPLVGAGVRVVDVLGRGAVAPRVDVAAASQQQTVREREHLIDRQ